MSAAEVRVGTRGSALALAQARLVVEALAGVGVVGRLVTMETHGDRRAPDTAWGEGAFVAAIEEALLDGRVDVAVHSAKDVPTAEDQRLAIAAYLPRADPRDALVLPSGRRKTTLVGLPAGTRIGTDSPRRAAFIQARRSDVRVHPLHGNVDTRLRRLDDGETDALVLACAGLDRLGLGHRIAERLDPATVPPAPGQGAIAVQARADDPRVLEALAAIDDGPTRLAVEAERELLRAAGGGCRSPIGALATLERDGLLLLAGAVLPGSDTAAIATRRGPASDGLELARTLAAAVTTAPAARDAEGARRNAGTAARRILVTRAAGQADGLAARLRAEGLEPVEVPAIAIEAAHRATLEAAARRLAGYDWVVVTSANGARALLAAALRIGAPIVGPAWAAVGPATREALEAGGVSVAVEPESRSAEALAAALPVRAGDRVLHARGSLADGALAEALRGAGAEVEEVIAYRTREAPRSSVPRLRAALAGGPVVAAIFTSGSTVRGLVSIGKAAGVDLTMVPAVCIGPGTAAWAERAGFRVLAVAPAADAATVAATAARALDDADRPAALATSGLTRSGGDV